MIDYDRYSNCFSHGLEIQFWPLNALSEAKYVSKRLRDKDLLVPVSFLENKLLKIEEKPTDG